MSRPSVKNPADSKIQLGSESPNTIMQMDDENGSSSSNMLKIKTAKTNISSINTMNVVCYNFFQL